jgi:AbrB family looped-hinge helix DNA binding protein
MNEVRTVGRGRVRKRGYTRVTAKNQITIPVDAMREAGVVPGDELQVVSVEDGKIVLERVGDPLETFAGSLTGVWPKDALKKLREEWP